MLSAWQNGLWDPPLLVFAVQMMLILVLGHALALAPPVSRVIDRIVNAGKSPAAAAYFVTFFTIIVALFNWGLGLIFGAIIARKTGERFARNGLKTNYPLIGAAGYSGLMVWHGGISGSAPIKVVEEGHLKSLMAGIFPSEKIAELPHSLPFEMTVFSPMNLTASLLLLLILPAFMAFWMKKSSHNIIQFPNQNFSIKTKENETKIGAEKLDYSRIFSLIFALLILAFTFYIPFLHDEFSLKFITPNFINFALLGLCLLFHKNFMGFLNAIDGAIGGAAGILIQFPLYFGIMGLMKSSGLIGMVSEFFISISNETTFPIFTFFSAGLVNIFVPSGGGQWAIQGPILIQAADQLGVSLSKSLMALAYGDQLTNMLQPFWALPLLGITGLKARDILPYTIALMAVGAVIFISVLLIF